MIQHDHAGSCIIMHEHAGSSVIMHDRAYSCRNMHIRVQEHAGSACISCRNMQEDPARSWAIRPLGPITSRIRRPQETPGPCYPARTRGPRPQYQQQQEGYRPSISSIRWALGPYQPARIRPWALLLAAKKGPGDPLFGRIKGPCLITRLKRAPKVAVRGRDWV